MDHLLEDLEGEPPNKQHEIFDQLEKELQSDESGNNDIAEFLLKSHRSQLLTVPVSSRVPKLLRKIGDLGGGDYLVQLVLDGSYDQSLILESLAQSNYSQSKSIEELICRYIEGNGIDIELLRPLLSNIDGDEAELPLDPYHDDQSTINRALKVIDALDTSYYDENIVEIYRRILNGQLSGGVENQIHDYFSRNSIEDIIPFLEERIRQSLQEKERGRRNISHNAVRALAAQGNEGIDILLSFLEELDHRDNQQTILNAISQSDVQITESHIEQFIALSDRNLGRDPNHSLAQTVATHGDLNDVLLLTKTNGLSEPRRFSDELFETLEEHDSVDDIIRFVEVVQNSDVVRQNRDQFIEIVNDHGTEGLIKLIEADLDQRIFDAIKEPVVNALLKKDDLYLETLIEILRNDTHRELVVDILHRRWKVAMSILLQKLKSTEHDSEIEYFQSAFKELSKDNVDSVLSQIIRSDERSNVEMEALRIGITSVESDSRSYAQDRLIEAIDENIGHPSLQELCICLDKFRFAGRNNQSFTGNQLAVPDRGSMPKPLPGLRDLVVQRHNENQVRSILDLLETLDSIGSSVYEELMAVLPDNVRQDIEEYRNSTDHLDNLRKEEIKDLIEEGEGLLIEFKHPAASDEKILREVESMLNTQGGTVLVGVDDSGNVVGLENTRWDSREEAETRFQSLVGSYVRPEPVVDSYSVETSEKTVLRIDVPSGEMKPYFHRNDDIANEVRIRMGSKKVHASRRHIINLIQHDSWYKTDP